MCLHYCIFNYIISVIVYKYFYLSVYMQCKLVSVSLTKLIYFRLYTFYKQQYVK